MPDYFEGKAPADHASPWGPIDDVPTLFVGRQEPLESLKDRYESGARIGVITGERGSGKTALARVFVASHGDRLFPSGVHYVHAEFLMHESAGPDPLEFSRVPGGVEYLLGASQRQGERTSSIRPDLIVIDDVETLSPRELRSLVDRANSRRTRVRSVARRLG